MLRSGETLGARDRRQRLAPPSGADYERVTLAILCGLWPENFIALGLVKTSDGIKEILMKVLLVTKFSTELHRLSTSHSTLGTRDMCPSLAKIRHGEMRRADCRSPEKTAGPLPESSFH